MNSCDKCTTNKFINVKQCTIQWYVEDNKVIHVSEDIITGVKDITKKKIGELVVSRGKKNTFVCMEIELVNDGKYRLA